MDIVFTAIIAVLGGLIVGGTGGYVGRRLTNSKRLDEAESKAARLLEEANEQQRSVVIEAKEEALKIRSAGESELRERRSEFQRMERRLSNREENVERRANNLERRERNLTEKEKDAEQLQSDLEESKIKELQRLEEISGLSVADAENLLMQRAEEDIQHELARKYRSMEEQAREEANERPALFYPNRYTAWPLR